MHGTHQVQQGSQLAPQVVTDEVTRWVRDAGVLLDVLQQLLVECQVASFAPPEMRGTLEKLLPAVRQCRAGQPTPEVLQAWMRRLAESSRPKSDGEFH